MPVGKRPFTAEERRVLDAMREIEMLPSSGTWRFRQHMLLALDRGEKISMRQAELLRAVAWELRKKMPFDVETFARSSIGAFPMVRGREGRLPPDLEV
jgi:hypothetical protein